MNIDRPIITALMLFAILLLVYFLVAPQYNSFKQLQNEFTTKQAQYIAEFNYYSEIDKTYEELREHQDDIKKVDSVLNQDPDTGKLIYLLQKLVKDSGLIMKNLSLVEFSSNSFKNEVSGNVKEVNLSASVSGGYKSLQNLLVSLENSSRIFEVTNISFGFGSQSTVNKTVTTQQVSQAYDYNLQIKTYSY